MPIDFSNLLSPQMIVNVSVPGASPQVHQNSIRQKSLTLMQSAGVGNALYRSYTHKNVRSLIMQQDFKNRQTLCAAVSPDGLVTEYDTEGQVVCQSTTEHLPDFVRNAWDQLSPEGNQSKAGLLISSRAWNDYMAHHDTLVSKAYEAEAGQEEIDNLPYSDMFGKSLRAVYSATLTPEFVQ